MIDRAEELGIPWPTLKATDVGNLVSFLNVPAPPKRLELRGYSGFVASLDWKRLGEDASRW